jgi:hypothetical protein
MSDTVTVLNENTNVPSDQESQLWNYWLLYGPGDAVAAQNPTVWDDGGFTTWDDLGTYWPQ